MFSKNILLAAIFIGLLTFDCIAFAADKTIPVSGIEANCRDGQVFLIWQEKDTPAGTTFNVYSSEKPITADNLSQAALVGHHIEQYSARDWWQDPFSFTSDANQSFHAGFVIANDQKPFDIAKGLFVHTLDNSDAAGKYFAVTFTSGDGNENKTILPGVNSLKAAVKGTASPIEPIWIGNGNAPLAGSGKGKSLYIKLHGRGGGVTAKPKGAPVSYLIFGDSTMGWREGIAFKFHITVKDDSIQIEPYDRAWTARPVMESKDKRDYCMAVNTWWYGYNSKIYETTLTKQTVVPNYTENRLLYLVDWAQRYFKTDADRTYLTGNSMGGSGTVSMILHHPKVFAAAYAEVPAVAYLPDGDLKRLECICGPLDDSAVTIGGRPFIKYMNGPANVNAADFDVPPLFMISAKSDKSISWPTKPVFYDAMNHKKQALCAYWSNAGHINFKDGLPAEVNDLPAALKRYSLNQSYPVFTNCSANKNAGDGKPKDGDLIGWINRGLSWKNVIDTPKEYSITITADYPGIKFPISVDVTLRRLQNFKVVPAQQVKIQIGDRPPYSQRIDSSGLLSVTKISIKDANGIRLKITS